MDSILPSTATTEKNTVITNNNENNNNDDNNNDMKNSEAIAFAAISQYISLPKSGKPQPHEHTALAAIVATLPHHTVDTTHYPSNIESTKNINVTTNDSIARVLCLATGTKSLPGSKRAPDGSVLNDNHAEVLARRALQRWMYEEIDMMISSNFEMKSHVLDDTFSLKSGVDIHLFVSHLPCGDAAILDQQQQQHHQGNDTSSNSPLTTFVGGSHNNMDSTVTSNNNTISTAANSVVGGGRTGAKPVTKRQRTIPTDEILPSSRHLSGNTIPLPLYSPIPPLSQGNNNTNNNSNNTATTLNAVQRLPQAHDVESYLQPQSRGVVRRKPGKGEPTYSVSCSDKIARWSMVGIQGALLSGVVGTGSLYLKSIVVAYPGSDSAAMNASDVYRRSLKRSFIDRIQPLLSRVNALYKNKQRSDGVDWLTKDIVLPDVSTCCIPFVLLHQLGFMPGCFNNNNNPDNNNNNPDNNNNNNRKVTCGYSLIWWASPSPSWKMKGLKPAAISLLSPHFNTNSLQVLSGGTCEVIVASLGILQGKSRKGNEPVAVCSQSKVCRKSLFRRFIELAPIFLNLVNKNTVRMSLKSFLSEFIVGKRDTLTYKEVKERVGSEYQSLWKILKQPPSTFEGWIPKQVNDQEFTL